MANKEIIMNLTPLRKPDIPPSVVNKNSYNSIRDLEQKEDISQDFHAVKRKYSDDVEKQSIEKETDRFKENESVRSYKKRRNEYMAYGSLKMMERLYGKYRNRNVDPNQVKERNPSGNIKFEVAKADRPLHIAGKYVKPKGSGGRMMKQEDAIRFLNEKNPNLTISDMQKLVNHSELRRLTFQVQKQAWNVQKYANTAYNITVGKIQNLRKEEINVKIKKEFLQSLFGESASQFSHAMSVWEARNILNMAYRKKNGRRDLTDVELSQYLNPTMTKNQKFGSLTYRKEKLITDKVLGVTSERRFWQESRFNAKNILKDSFKGTMRHYWNEQKDDMKDGSFGDYTIAESIDTADRLRKRGDMAFKGLKVTTKATKGTIKLVQSANRTISNAVTEGHRTLNEARMFSKDGKGSMSTYFHQKVSESARKKREEIKKRSIDAQKRLTERFHKESVKRVSEKVGGNFLNSAIAKIAPTFMGLFIAFAVIILIVFILLLMFTTLIATKVMQPLEDVNSMKAVHELTTQWENTWNEIVLQDNGDEDISMYDRYTLPIEGYNPENYKNTCEINVLCDDEPAVCRNNFINYYAILLTQYDMDTLNVGVNYGNENDADAPSYEEMVSFLRSVFEEMYPTDEINGYPRIYMENKRHEITSVDYSVTYVETNIDIHVSSVTDIISYLGWDSDKINTYNMIRMSLQESLLDMSNVEDYDMSWFDYSFLNTSFYDNMTKEQLKQAIADAPTVDVTREEFAQNLHVCVPSGKIGYRYGGKDASTGELDCSGFIAYMLDEYGADLGDSTTALWDNSYEITNDALRAGDLVFKQAPNENGINHVGFYLGNNYEEGKFAHCASSSGTICNSYKGFVHYRRLILKFKENNEGAYENA